MENNSLEGNPPELHTPGEPLDYTTPESGQPMSGGPQRSRYKLSKKLLALIVASIITFLLIVFLVSSLVAKKEVKQTKQTTVTINTQSLDNGTLNKLTAQAGPTNQTKQQLTISPQTLFKDSVQVNGALQADKDVAVGGNLTVHGSTTLQGATSINSNLAVRGSLSVSGTLTAPALNVGSLGISSLSATGALSFGGHLIPNGVAPAVKPSVATAGGTVTIDGNDTSGTVTINTGGGPVIAGEMAIITFRTRFATTPKVQLTPINAAASSLRYYASRNAGFFTIDTSTAPTAGTSYVFDYLVTQ